MPPAAQSNAAIAQEVSHTSSRRNVSIDVTGRRHESTAGPGSPTLPASAGTSYTDGSEDSRDSRGLDSLEPGQPIHLHVPLNLSDKAKQPTPLDPKSFPESDTESLISARNLFAFLTGQSLVASRGRPTFYHIFLNIAQALTFYEFSNLDGSTFGEVANFNFKSVFDNNSSLTANMASVAKWLTRALA